MPRVVKTKVAPEAPKSELEALNDAEDLILEGALVTATLAPPLPPRVIAPPLPVPAERPCALDGAPVNSKIVVVLKDGKKFPVLMTPAGEKPLAADDVAWTLPADARVRKDGESEYVADQLNHNRPVPSLVCGTARAAIAQFHQHFHG